MYECDGGRGNTHKLTQDMREKGGGVFLAARRGGEGRRLVFMLLLKPECSDIEKLVEVRELTNCSFKEL